MALFAGVHPVGDRDASLSLRGPCLNNWSETLSERRTTGLQISCCTLPMGSWEWWSWLEPALSPQPVSTTMAVPFQSQRTTASERPTAGVPTYPTCAPPLLPLHYHRYPVNVLVLHGPCEPGPMRALRTAAAILSPHVVSPGAHTEDPLMPRTQPYSGSRSGSGGLSWVQDFESDGAAAVVTSSALSLANHGVLLHDGSTAPLK